MPLLAHYSVSMFNLISIFTVFLTNINYYLLEGFIYVNFVDKATFSNLMIQLRTAGIVQWSTRQSWLPYKVDKNRIPTLPWYKIAKLGRASFIIRPLRETRDGATQKLDMDHDASSLLGRNGISSDPPSIVLRGAPPMKACLPTNRQV